MSGLAAPFLAAFVVEALLSLGLDALNLGHQRREGDKVPPELAGSVDEAQLGKIAAYTRARAVLGMARAALGAGITAVFLFGGGLGAYDRLVTEVTGSFVLHGVVFFLGLSWAAAVLSLPLSLYGTFVVEARHGFNRQSLGGFFGDWLKGRLLGTVLTSVAVAGAFELVRRSPGSWWVWVWLFLLGFGLLSMYLAPVLIEPLFFKVEPLRAEGLEARVRALAEAAGVRVERVFQVDASRRSGHSNAYFTGIGRTKRVVLFDTLLAQMNAAEILAVLAHELGHWKKRHILVRLVITEAVALVAAYAAFRLVAWGELPALVGLEAASFPARLVVLGALASVATFPLAPLSSWWSRRHEWQADAFAAELLGRSTDLASALSKLARENLSNLHPHPLYAAFYYSHPPVVERIRRLGGRVSARVLAVPAAEP